MADDTGMIIKLGIFGVGGYLAYQYLQSSGLWAQWFGGGYSSVSSLLTYCNANPNGTATYGGQTAPCSSWIAAARGTSSSTGTPAPTPTPPPSPSPTPTPTPVASSLTVQQLLTAAGVTDPNTVMTVDEWNWYVSNRINPNATVTDLSSVGITRGVNDSITAQAYLNLRQQSGLSGLRGFRGLAANYVTTRVPRNVIEMRGYRFRGRA